MLSIVSNSPHLATYARPASPTCSSPCCQKSRQISRTIKRTRHWVIMKERQDEYSIKRCAGVLRVVENHARGHLLNSADVLVGATRIVGEPFHLCRALGRRIRRSVRLRAQLDCGYLGRAAEAQSGAASSAI